MAKAKASGWHGFLQSAPRFREDCRGAKGSRAGSTLARLCRRLAEAVERDGWDGDWYRRAFFDDGTPLGSAENEECRIDSIAQSWAVISGAAPLERASAAVAEAERQLLRWNDRLALLFTPPFDKGPRSLAISRDILPGFAKTAANIPTPQFGWLWRKQC